MVGDTTTTSGASSPTRLSETIETPRDNPVFNHEQCLLCNKTLGSFESNVAHMQKAHGLFVPDRQRLIVDLETLFSYLHLVIFGYHECICCGTQRNSALAVQQHMLGKGHCRFDIDVESEYADFYDFSGSEAEAESGDSGEDQVSDDDTPAPPKKGKADGQTVQIDEHSLRLPSGRVISNRSQPQNSTRRQLIRLRHSVKPDLLEGAPASSQEDLAQPSSSSSTSLITRADKGGVALTKAEKQENRFAKQLASLRASDERSLAHLPQSEQRALLATTQKQVEKANRVEERYRGRLEGLGNKFLMTHFVKDAADKRTLWK